MIIETFLIVDDTISVLISVIIFASLKLWTWLQLCHTQNEGMVELRAPLLKVLDSQAMNLDRFRWLDMYTYVGEHTMLGISLLLES